MSKLDINNDQFLKGKRVLLTSFSFALYGGAELNAVELAEQLKKYGAKVSFFSYDIAGPLSGDINSRFDTEVITDNIFYLAENEDPENLKNTQLDINNYDYIWVGGNVIPISIVRQLKYAKKLPKFIFIHMSSLVAYPLDAPLMPDFEKSIASKILTVGNDTTTKNIYRILGDDIPLFKWYNPVPEEFKYLEDRKGNLERIAVVSSSHPTDEILGIREGLEERGVAVDFVGRFNNNAKLVDASFYDNYDLIIGIGKNVKYSLVSGVPIYIYGRLGGYGYLDNEAIQGQNTVNFSGRGGQRKTSNQIVKEVIDGYGEALQFHKDNRNEFINEYSLDNVTKRLFCELESIEAKNVTFSDLHINWIVSMQINLMQRIHASAEVRRLQEEVEKKTIQLDSVNSQLSEIQESRAYRYLMVFRNILHNIRSML